MAASAEVPVLSTDTGFPPEMVGSREAKEFFDENGYMIVYGTGYLPSSALPALTPRLGSQARLPLGAGGQRVRGHHPRAA